MDSQTNYSVSTMTIAAISTPQAVGGLGIVRISGPHAREIAGKVFSAKHGKTFDQIKGYTALYGRVHGDLQGSQLRVQRA